MSAYENVVKGKLKLKGKALDVKAAGIKKKKKKQHLLDDVVSHPNDNQLSSGGESRELVIDEANKEEEVDDAIASKSTQVSGGAGGAGAAHWDDHLTPAERRYMEQREKIDMHKMAKTSNKSHRDRIEDFNQYLANMSEHYDIPKVGPG